MLTRSPGGPLMFFAQSHLELHSIRQSVERVGNVSDNIVHLGPFRLGLDGILTWIPVVGELYSVASGGLLIIQAARARATMATLVSATLMIAARSGLSAVPIPFLSIPFDLAADFFTAHKWVANMIVKEMDNTLFIEGSRHTAAENPEVADLLASIRAGSERRRVVFLG